MLGHKVELEAFAHDMEFSIAVANNPVNCGIKITNRTTDAAHRVNNYGIDILGFDSPRYSR